MARVLRDTSGGSTAYRYHLCSQLGTLGISEEAGNAGTGKCRRGADAHGCEFAPVAVLYNLYNEILRVLC